MIQSRKKQIQQIIGLKRLDGLLVTNITNIRYLTGFTGSSGFVIITRNRGIFFTDFRYREQSEKEVKGFEIGIEKGKRIRLIRSFVKKAGIKKLGFEKTISYEFYELLKKISVQLLPQKHIIEDMRKIKDEEEIENIKKAVKRAEEAFLKIKPRIRVGVKEREIALRLEEQLKRVGCKDIPFDTIVASGKNSSMPHARPSEKKIEKGDFVIIDWGGEYNGYYSDMTRTFLMDCVDLDKKIEIYNTVNYARQRAIKSIKEGLKTQEIDSIVRNIIKKAGYGEFFGHGTGHGVGLDVHEYPHVSWNKGEKIRNNMVFTIEPGIYIPELGGVRIEDMILVRNGKAELLTDLSRELEIIK
ncbi:aminopeptidase P family protein [hot springs metagenome]|uniref:Aminopeptidase P family protein n=1 Tax=hot springs metagenome TaxID=433727 RepID=A0A5J4L478_9ZZZZ